MPELTYNVRFNGKLITLPKTKRDFEFEKFQACLSIVQDRTASYSENERAIALALSKTLKTQLERK